MDGNCSETSANVQNTGNFNEAVCIDGMRVYDSCSELQSTALIQIYSVPAFSNKKTEAMYGHALLLFF
ncbi:hypothetical protein [Caproiciproducens sp.]|uniref:hypothetical protein n=1 Tax=Caproiciproducens sp. TaxID=1954376 RepID=UPI00289F2586|nr:hypothetical protein [Caproiciproducens sp.]